MGRPAKGSRGRRAELRAPRQGVDPDYRERRCEYPGGPRPRALPDDPEDRGLCVVEDSISVAGQAFEFGRMMVFRPGDRISAAGPASRAAHQALSEQRQVVWECRSMPRPKRRLGGEGAPLGQRGRAPLFVDLAGDEMALLIEMVVDLGMN